jgi:hypothetical protein
MAEQHTDVYMSPACDPNGSSADALQRKQDETLTGKRGKPKKGKVNRTPTRRIRSRKF